MSGKIMFSANMILSPDVPETPITSSNTMSLAILYISLSLVIMTFIIPVLSSTSNIMLLFFVSDFLYTIPIIEIFSFSFFPSILCIEVR